MKTKTKTILLVLAGFSMFAACNSKNKQPKEESLWDEMPRATQVEPSDGKVQLNTVISPPPPGNTDRNDTSSVIEPDKVSASDEIYKVTDVDFLAAYPNGGWDAFASYIQSVRYPKEVKDKGVKGTLSVLFVIEKDGSISDIEVLKSVDKQVENEIINALQTMPLWKPGKKDGLYVRTNYGFSLIYQ